MTIMIPEISGRLFCSVPEEMEQSTKGLFDSCFNHCLLVLDRMRYQPFMRTDNYTELISSRAHSSVHVHEVSPSMSPHASLHTTTSTSPASPGTQLSQGVSAVSVPVPSVQGNTDRALPKVVITRLQAHFAQLLTQALSARTGATWTFESADGTFHALASTPGRGASKVKVLMLSCGDNANANMSHSPHRLEKDSRSGKRSSLIQTSQSSLLAPSPPASPSPSRKNHRTLPMRIRTSTTGNADASLQDEDGADGTDENDSESPHRKRSGSASPLEKRASLKCSGVRARAPSQRRPHEFEDIARTRPVRRAHVLRADDHEGLLGVNDVSERDVFMKCSKHFPSLFRGFMFPKRSASEEKKTPDLLSMLDDSEQQFVESMMHVLSQDSSTLSFWLETMLFHSRTEIDTRDGSIGVIMSLQDSGNRSVTPLAISSLFPSNGLGNNPAILSPLFQTYTDLLKLVSSHYFLV